MVFGYNSPEWVVALWALWLAGAVPVLANRWWSAAEIEHAVDVLAPRHVLADTELPVDTPTTALGDLRAAFDADSADDVPPPVRTDSDEPALILFTSGSSGMPKAVELSRRSVICNQHNILPRNRRLPAPARRPTRLRRSAWPPRRCSTSAGCPACSPTS